MRLRLELRGNDGNAAGFVIPDEVVDELGGGHQPKVVVTIGKHTWRSSIANMGGQFMLGVSMANREAAGVAAGQTLDVDVVLDTAPRTVDVPDDLAAELAADAGARETWATWSFTRQKEAARLLTGGQAARDPQPPPDEGAGRTARLNESPSPYDPRVDAAPKAQPRDLAHWVILVAGVVYAVGVGLLALGVYVDLPGFLSAYGDPEAWWPIAVNLTAGLVSFGTWRWVNRRNSRPFAVVLLGFGLATVVVLASASYAAVPGRRAQYRLERRDPGGRAGDQQLRDRHVHGATDCDTDGVPLALQFMRLTQLIVLLVAATSALAALLRTQVDRVVVRWSPRLSVVLGLDATSAPLLPALATDSERYTLAVLTTDPLAPWIGQARAAGWRVVITDPSRVETLVRLLGRPPGRHALRRLAVLPPDSTEAQRLMTSRSRPRSRAASPSPATTRCARCCGWTRPGRPRTGGAATCPGSRSGSSTRSARTR